VLVIDEHGLPIGSTSLIVEQKLEVALVDLFGISCGLT
jgi:hypothetical protein